MKIKDVRLIPVKTRREDVDITNQHVIVRVFTDEGIEGIGEMSDLSHLPAMVFDIDSLEKFLKKILRGQDPFNLTKLEILLENLYTTQAYGYSYQCSNIRAGVDIALYDLLGKFLNRPVYDLLGGKLRDKLETCYPIFRQFHTEEVSRNIQIVERRFREGFSTIRFYCGANLEADKFFLQTLQEKFGDKIKVKSFDLSNILDAKTALRVIKRLQEYKRPSLVESVCNIYDYEGMAEVREKIDLPVSEHIQNCAQALKLINNRSVDIFNISVAYTGGIYSAREIFTLAKAAGIKCLIGTTQELSVGTAAQAHLGASFAELDYCCDPTGPVLYTDDVVKSRVKYEKGHLIVPQGPGLGVELDEDKLEKLKTSLSIDLINIPSAL